MTLREAQQIAREHGWTIYPCPGGYNVFPTGRPADPSAFRTPTFADALIEMAARDANRTLRPLSGGAETAETPADPE